MEEEIKKRMPDGKAATKTEKPESNDVKPGEKEALQDNRMSIEDIQEQRTQGEEDKEDQARRQGPYGVQEPGYSEGE